MGKGIGMKTAEEVIDHITKKGMITLNVRDDLIKDFLTPEEAKVYYEKKKVIK